MDTTSRRTTVYFDPQIHRALRLKAAATDRSVSDLVNDAVHELLLEDADDLEAFEDRAEEATLSFEQVLKDLRRSGKL
ncbi:MAG: ribbon-helix-helix domain-containing protein [Myxococcota bacterium]